VDMLEAGSLFCLQWIRMEPVKFARIATIIRARKS
jgi:hypothetical protein